MKSINKIKIDQTKKIEDNNLTVIKYNDVNDIECFCNICGHNHIDNYRNLSYKNFKCRYCVLISSSKLIKDGIVQLIGFDKSGVILRCNNGHTYTQDRRNLLAGKKCVKCYIDNKIFTKEDVIKKFKNIHGDNYIYNFDNFTNLHSKIEIICNKGHRFTQKVSNHLQGKACPVCNQSYGERMISVFLDRNSIIYERQKRFTDCKNISELVFDFYLTDKNILIEYDGIQHFQPVKLFGGIEGFENTKIRDNIKNQYCSTKGINLIRISYKDNINDKLSSILSHI